MKKMLVTLAVLVVASSVFAVPPPPPTFSSQWSYRENGSEIFSVPMKIAELTVEHFIKWVPYQDEKGQTRYHKKASHITIGLVTREGAPVDAFLFSSVDLKPQTVKLTVDGESRSFQTVSDGRNSSDFVWFKDGDALFDFMSKGQSFQLANATFTGKEVFSNMKISKLNLNRVYKAK